MKEEKDIVWIATFLITGILLGYTITNCISYPYIFSIILGIIPPLLLIFLIYYKYNKIIPYICIFLPIGANLYINNEIYTTIEEVSTIKSWANYIHNHINNIITDMNIISCNNKSLIKAFILGDKSDLTKNIVQSFRNSGLSHILALSGLHLGMLSLCILYMFKIFGNYRIIRYIRAIILILILGFYVIITQANPSIVRAYIFISTFLCLNLLNRKSNLLSVCIFSLFIQLIYLPSSLFSIGFQLSYLAIIGIATLFPIMQNWYPKSDTNKFNVMKKIWDLSSLTIVCQIFTTPLSYYYFKSFNPYFLIANLVTMPLFSIILPLCLICILLEAISLAPNLLLHILDKLLDALMFIVQILANL